MKIAEGIKKSTGRSASVAERMNAMITKPTIETTKMKRLVITIQYVFRASFNDTMYLEEKSFPLEELGREQLTWFDPFCGRSNRNEILVAVAYCSDDKLVLLQKEGDKIQEQEAAFGRECILCEDYNESMLLAAHIRVRA